MSTTTSTLIWKISIFQTPDEGLFSLFNPLNRQAFEKKVFENSLEEVNLLIDLIVKSVLFSDPTKKDFDESDFERILGKDQKKFRGEKDSYFKLLKQVVEEYYEKTKNQWKNVQWYSPFYSLFDRKPTKHERQDYLFEFASVINRSLTTSTHEKSSDFWLGKETQPNNTEGFEEKEADEFQIISSKEHLLLFLNKDDYNELEIGITKKIEGYGKTISLDILKKKALMIYPMNGMKTGYARLVDKRAFKITPFIEGDSKCIPEGEGLRIISHVKFVINISDDFVGCLFAPSKEVIKTLFYRFLRFIKPLFKVFPWIFEKIMKFGS